jgi:glutathione S-transferase
MRWMPQLAHASIDRMNILYYSPRACSLAVHIVLEEIGAPFETRCVAIARGEHESPEYSAVNPLQRVPALVTEHGLLTEAAAILQYLGRAHPEARLLPSDPELARVQEWLGFLASSVHPAFAPIFRPHRFADDEHADSIKRRFRERAHTLLVHAARRFGAGPWVMGEQFGIVDAYLLVFLLWAKRLELPNDGLEVFAPFVERALARPSVMRACATEQREANGA